MTIDILALLNKNPLVLGPAADTESRWQHWRLARDSHEIAWLVLDRADASANTLNEPVLDELDTILAELEQQQPAALVLRSAKAGGFCVGADVGMFRGVTDRDVVQQKLQKAHRIVDRLEALPFTTVAVIHGLCLGGGLELALACDHRIAIANAKLGLPEVKLGLHPGLGGTYRAPAQINPIEAMTLMLTGRTVPARKAKALGLVDAVTEERHVTAAVEATAKGQLKAYQRPAWLRLLDLSGAKNLLARRMRAQTANKVSREHYPAPFRLINLWQKSDHNLRRAQQREILSFSRLVASPQGQNLVRVFFLQEHLKAKGDGDFPPVRHVHVIGAGTMGGDIAGWCAYSGLRVTLQDPQGDMIAATVKRTAQLCRAKHLSGSAARAVMDRLTPDPSGRGAGVADLVIEAVPENIELKRKIYQAAEAAMKPGALLATNTSSIPLDTLSEQLADPSRFVGLHFFNPVAKMPLVEVIHHSRIGDDTLARGRSFCRQIDRLAVKVQSAPGFLVNRVLTPYLLEAMAMVEEGVAPETIDRAAVEFGMPVGPVELADQVGLDICVAVADMLRERLDTAMPDIPRWVRDKVDQGHTGRKAGQGIYAWDNGKAVKKHDTPPLPRGDVDRLILPMLNTCVGCLREGIVGDADSLDAAVIFGTGFAPFRGGPLHYARERGSDDIVRRLGELAASHGERFKPDAGWKDGLTLDAALERAGKS